VNFVGILKIVTKESMSRVVFYMKYKNGMIGHILPRNCLLKQVIEGKIKGEMELTR
jgi:hypothetical protein